MAHIRKVDGKKGVKWQAIIKHKGKQRAGTFPSKRLAQEWATKIEHELFNQQYFPERVPSEHTVGEAIARYLTEILPQKSIGTQNKQRQVLKWWKSCLDDCSLNHVEASLIERHKMMLWQERGMSPYTVNVYLSTLSHVFTVACSPTWKWAYENPCRHVKKLREDRDRLPSVNESQLNMFLYWCEQSQSKYLSLFVRLALATGARKRELLDAKWRQIDFERKTMTFENTKNKKRRSVPLDEGTVEILQSYYGGTFTDEMDHWNEFHSEKYVFENPQTGKPLRTIFFAFKKARERAGLPSLRVHDLRHLYASLVAEKGKADIGTIADLLGHANLQQTRRYRHLTEKHTADIVQRMAEQVFKKEYNPES